MATVIFNGEPVEGRLGESLFSVADRSAQGSYEIASSCQRSGACRECILQVNAGHHALSPPSPEEAFLQTDPEPGEPVFRLACRARIIRAEATIEVETFKRRLDIAVEGRPPSYRVEPWVERRAGRVYADDRELARWDGPLYGLALDIGTTTVVLHVVDLLDGRTLFVRAFENPQKYGGSDVMHRISFDRSHPGQLHRTLIAHLNQTLRSLPIDRTAVFALAVAGNPTMRDLFFGLDVQSIGQSPYLSQTQADVIAGRRQSTSVRTQAGELKLAINPAACVYGLPLVSHHVGADMAAVLVTLPPEPSDAPFMVIDMGTNTEVAVGNRHRIICASCPAGPAFEGGRLACGMAACDGAISALRRENGGWRITTIGNAPPRGICGSGLVDLLAELRADGAMDEMGRFCNGDSRIVISPRPPVYLTGREAAELAQAKAANALGQKVLLRRLGLTVSGIGTYYLAGAFANKIDLTNAQRIGLLLPVPQERIVRIGNASIEGAKAVLLSRTMRDRVEAMVRSIEHVELEREPDFFDLFAELTSFAPIS